MGRPCVRFTVRRLTITTVTLGAILGLLARWTADEPAVNPPTKRVHYFGGARINITRFGLQPLGEVRHSVEYLGSGRFSFEQVGPDGKVFKMITTD